MDSNQQAAYVMAQSASALIEAMGMLSENMQRVKNGESLAWNDDEFNSLITKYGIGHNDVLGFYQQ